MYRVVGAAAQSRLARVGVTVALVILVHLVHQVAGPPGQDCTAEIAALRATIESLRSTVESRNERLNNVE